MVFVISANLCCVSAGAMLGWTSSVIPLLKNNDTISIEYNPLGQQITNEEDSWISSLVSIGAIIGSFVAGYLAERYCYFVQNHASYLLSSFRVDRNSLKISNKNSSSYITYFKSFNPTFNHAIWQYFTDMVERRHCCQP